jgi:uncharacterized protein (DUF2235 family)
VRRDPSAGRYDCRGNLGKMIAGSDRASSVDGKIACFNASDYRGRLYPEDANTRKELMPKNIVICCDGTTNEIATDSTNVVRLYRMLVRDARQRAYYDAGVGTMADPGAMTRCQKWVSQNLDAAIGHTLKANFALAYRFLARVYEPGDRIYLFGFSRGAYTVRALAGAIHFLGLLRPELEDLAQLAWTIYSDEDLDLPVTHRFRGGNRFKKSFSVQPDVIVHFVGVWDTVSAFGWVSNLRTLPSTANNPSIDHIRHALAIDERRALFNANIFRPADPAQHASIKQVWFAGTHSDVGGGFPAEEGALSRITLQWMLREAVGQGLLIDDANRVHLLQQIGSSEPDAFGPFHESLVGCLYKSMECIPRRTWNGAKKKMAWSWPHRGRSRFIGPNAVVHHSVLERVNNAAMAYHPRNLPSMHTVEV